jgi:hypothetical protein
VNDDLPHSKPVNPPAYTPHTEGEFDHQPGQFNQPMGSQFGQQQQQQQQTFITQQPMVCTSLDSL